MHQIDQMSLQAGGQLLEPAAVGQQLVNEFNQAKRQALIISASIGCLSESFNLTFHVSSPQAVMSLQCHFADS